MPRDNPTSLWNSIIGAGNLSARVAIGAQTAASWGELAAGDLAGDRMVALRGRSVLLATVDQLAAAAALIELDGIARRIVLYPPDVSREHLALVAECAAVDAIVVDQPALAPIVSLLDPRIECIVLGSDRAASGTTSRYVDRSSGFETEWILLTSGTTGAPKLVVHTLASLTGAIEIGSRPPASTVWSTFYDIRRYGGLQIFLRAALTGTPLVLPGSQEPTAGFLARAGALGVTHISGTPSHWRCALMSPSTGRIAPAYVRLSGEIADQAILNQLRTQYPQAKIAHAFASTEAGVAFEVNDGFMGVPWGVIGRAPQSNAKVEMKMENGTLRVLSNRTASCYLGEGGPALKDAEGFVDTGDALELRDGRYYFVGRKDGTINVGGKKVHPEEVEAVINRHPEVSMSLVKPRKNPIVGALVVADVVLRTPPQPAGEAAALVLQSEILQFCRRELALHKVPVAINFVPALAMAETGKLVRQYA